MRVSRLYVESRLQEGERIIMDEEAAHYVRTVLRLKKDSATILFNGQGGEYKANLVEVSRKKVSADVKAWIDRSVESALHIEFGLAVSRSERMDFAVQKSVELGVNRITPLLTERCVVQLKGDRITHKLRHWQKIAQHAAEQSGRTLLPEIKQPCDLADWMNHQTGLKVFLDPNAGQVLKQLLPVDDRVTLLSGPEGGFTFQEREAAIAEGFAAVRLGARILRTETAALAAIASVQTLWGDFA